MSAKQIDLVLGNLIDNAVTRGDGTVGLTVIVADQHALVQVSDEGPGLPIGSSRTPSTGSGADPARTTPGSGLGLALAHRVLSGLGELHL